MLVDNDTFVELAQAADKGLYLRFICSFEEDFRKPVSNVIGLIEGSDPKLKNEYIIVGAHFDHVGDNKNGTYNSGALDNASGTAGLVEIARVIKSGKIQPKKSILFIAFNGEESGFTGSEYYVNNPVYPLDRAAMINMDMIGASKEMPITIASADKSGYGLQDEMYEYARALGIEARKGDMAGSDHYSFAQVGVASVMLIDEDWGNGYHSPNDNMEDISKTKIEQIVKLVLHYIDKNAY
nr:M28 family metallopeptidase [Lutispora saccharofermentans]